MVLKQVYDAGTGGTEPENPAECLMVFPRTGNFLQFDGCLAHGVLDSTAPEERITFLINWWPHQPQVRHAPHGGQASSCHIVSLNSQNH